MIAPTPAANLADFAAANLADFAAANLADMSPLISVVGSYLV